MRFKRVIRRGRLNSRVEFDDGHEELVPNEQLERAVWPTVPQLSVVPDPGQAPALVVVPQPLPTAEQAKEVVVHQTVAERFAHMESLVDMVIKGQAPSLLICGDAGIGKTYLVRQRLKQSGMQEKAVTADAKEPDKSKGPKRPSPLRRPTTYFVGGPSKREYLFVKGHSSPMGLYTLLHDNRNAVIVFDDCDSVFKDAVAVNILKAALDSYDTRTVTWASGAAAKMGLETRFEFTGKIIFISNIPLSKLDDAVKSRSFTIDISLTRDELCHRMSEVLKSLEPTVPFDLKVEVLNHLSRNMKVFTEFNMRTLIKAIRIRQSGHADWKEMVLKFA